MGFWRNLKISFCQSSLGIGEAILFSNNIGEEEERDEGGENIVMDGHSPQRIMGSGIDELIRRRWKRHF